MKRKPITSSSDSSEQFFRAAFSVDLVLLTFQEGRIKVLLQKKEEESHKGMLGLPGKLVMPEEDTDSAIEDFMAESIGAREFYKKQLKAFTEIGRHPMGRVVTIAYYGLIPLGRINEEMAEGFSWHDFFGLPELTYDHDRIARMALKRFRKGLLRHPTVFELLEEEFIVSDVMKIFECAFKRKLDAPNFRRQVIESPLVIPLGKVKTIGSQLGRKPQLYSFDKAKYKTAHKQRIGFNF